MRGFYSFSTSFTWIGAEVGVALSFCYQSQLSEVKDQLLPVNLKVKLAQEVNSQLLLVNQKPQHMIQLGLCVELRKLPTAMQVPTSKLAEEDDDEWSRPYNVIDLTDESCDDSDDIIAGVAGVMTDKLNMDQFAHL